MTRRARALLTVGAYAVRGAFWVAGWGYVIAVGVKDRLFPPRD